MIVTMYVHKKKKKKKKKPGRDSQRYLLAMVYHVEMYSLRTILFLITVNLSQIPKVVYQYNHN